MDEWRWIFGGFGWIIADIGWFFLQIGWIISGFRWIFPHTGLILKIMEYTQANFTLNLLSSYFDNKIRENK